MCQLNEIDPRNDISRQNDTKPIIYDFVVSFSRFFLYFEIKSREIQTEYQRIFLCRQIGLVFKEFVKNLTKVDDKNPKNCLKNCLNWQEIVNIDKDATKS